MGLDPIAFAIPAGATLFREFPIAIAANPSTGIVIDSVLFDGAAQCNASTNDWRYNNTLSIRGENVVRNSWFVNTPSENLTTCGATVDANTAFNLEGSFVHKSCGPGQQLPDLVINNHVENVNLATNAVSGHSEGAITLSLNAGEIFLSGNVFRCGREGVLGVGLAAGGENIVAHGDYYEDFDRLITIQDIANAQRFRFYNVTMSDVGGL